MGPRSLHTHTHTHTLHAHPRRIRPRQQTGPSPLRGEGSRVACHRDLLPNAGSARTAPHPHTTPRIRIPLPPDPDGPRSHPRRAVCRPNGGATARWWRQGRRHSVRAQVTRTRARRRTHDHPPPLTPRPWHDSVITSRHEPPRSRPALLWFSTTLRRGSGSSVGRGQPALRVPARRSNAGPVDGPKESMVFPQKHGFPSTQAGALCAVTVLLHYRSRPLPYCTVLCRSRACYLTLPCAVA